MLNIHVSNHDLKQNVFLAVKMLHAKKALKCDIRTYLQPDSAIYQVLEGVQVGV